jgi:hypothetical protein
MYSNGQTNAGRTTTTKGQFLLNTEMLKPFLTDPELRKQITRLLTQKTYADSLTAEALAYLARQLIGVVWKTKSGTAAANVLQEAIADYLKFCETLVNLQIDFSKSLLKKLETVSDAARPAPATVTMNLAAAQDSVARGSILVENTRSAAIFVDFETTPFVSEDGSQLVAAEVVFDPARLDLQPEQEAKIEFILKVGEQFKPGTMYLATVTIRGLDAPNLLIRLLVEPARDDAAPSPPPAESGSVETTVARPVKAKSRPPKSKTAVARRAKPSKARRKAR